MNIAFLLMMLATFPMIAHGALDSSKVVKAEAKKMNTYIRDGVVVGGDADVRDVLIEDIRRARNEGFERVVVDLKNPSTPDASENPFFQVSVEPDRRKVLVSIFGKARTGFNAQKIRGLFAKSSLITKLELLPQVDQGVWMFAMTLKEAPAVEVFHLSSPSRIILDLKLPPGARSEPAKTGAGTARKSKAPSQARKSQARAARPAAPKTDALPRQSKDGEDAPASYDEFPE